jgi:cobalt/nickel transport system permease protein
VVFGAVAGGFAVLGATLILSAELLILGEAFREIAALVLAAHVPIILIETAVIGLAAGFLQSVKPEMLIRARGSGHGGA